MRRGNSLRLLGTYCFPWQVLHVFCTLLLEDGADWSVQPASCPVGTGYTVLRPAGFAARKWSYASVQMARYEKPRTLISFSVVWELHKFESSSALFFASLITNLVSIVILSEEREREREREKEREGNLSI